MQRRRTPTEVRILPHGWPDVGRQIALFGCAYGLYQVVRGAVADHGSSRPFADATRIIDLERAAHLFIEPGVQAWTAHVDWLREGADWVYLNAHVVVTLGVLVFIYLRRNGAFCFVRNMFMIAMALALVGYAAFPTAPPWLMPGFGFTDSIGRFLGVAHLDTGAAGSLVNFYAAVPSVHVCFAVLVALTMTRLVRSWTAKVSWTLYPLLISFVVVATGNHYLLDVTLGALTAAASALVAQLLLARARPQAWNFPGPGVVAALETPNAALVAGIDTPADGGGSR
jgi:hypothetical protein